MTFADILEGGNGLWGIIAGWLTAFMIYHVLRVRAQRRIPWRRLIFNFRINLSVQIALGVLASSVAIFMTRSVLWWTRHYHPEFDVLMPHSLIYGAGTAIGIVGFLCILRSVSQPVFGHWPWIGALASSALYSAWWVWDKLV